MNSEVTVTFHGPEAAPALAAALEQLYGNIFATVAKAGADGSPGDVSAYVARRDGAPLAILLFRRHGGRVSVLNEAIALADDEIDRFAGHVFDVWPQVSAVSFRAIAHAGGALRRPHQRFNGLEDIVLSLPPTRPAYLDSLGKNMRADLQRYGKKLARDLPALHFALHSGNAVTDATVREIVALSGHRMRVKRQRCLHDEAGTDKLLALVRSHGAVMVASMEGRVCAGVICTVVGGNYFMHVIAHDPRYDAYRLGKLCCFQAICAAIDGGGREFHFLWGRYSYKYRLGGVQRELDHVTVYRSHWHRLRHWRLGLLNAVRGHGRRVKRWAHAAERASHWTGRLAQLLWGAPPA
ncbi:MAG: GNAT family N-acetyltransferase [Pseudomonadota bacterium]